MHLALILPDSHTVVIIFYDRANTMRGSQRNGLVFTLGYNTGILSLMHSL